MSPTHHGRIAQIAGACILALVSIEHVEKYADYVAKTSPTKELLEAASQSQLSLYSLGIGFFVGMTCMAIAAVLLPSAVDTPREMLVKYLLSLLSPRKGRSDTPDENQHKDDNNGVS